MKPRRPSSPVVLAMDIGSSSLRTALFDRQSQRLAGSAATREYKVDYTDDGGAELDPKVLLRAAKTCVRTTLRAGGKTRIAAVGGSGFWHSLLGLGRDLQPITPIWTWADARSAVDAEKLRKELDETTVHAQTGCMLRAPYWPAKLRWARRTRPQLFRRVFRWVSPADWIFDELFGSVGSSASMASGTGLYNLREGDWDARLLKACGVLPEQLSPIARVGTVWRKAKVFPALGDGAASNLGSGAVAPRIVAINFGTSAAVRVIERKSRTTALPAGLFRHVVDTERRLLGGAVSNAGNLHQWCLRELRVPDTARFSRADAADDTLTALPFWVRERAPTWPENMKGVVVGFTQSTTAAEFLRATTCSTFYRLADILERIEAATGRARTIIVSGGILHAPDAVRVLADSLGRDVRLSHEPEASLRGAAIHALAQIGSKMVPLKPGRLIRHHRHLSAKHRVRRQQQAALEHSLGKRS